jgi:hypothetical protein
MDYIFSKKRQRRLKTMQFIFVLLGVITLSVIAAYVLNIDIREAAYKFLSVFPDLSSTALSATSGAFSSSNFSA